MRHPSTVEPYLKWVSKWASGTKMTYNENYLGWAPKSPIRHSILSSLRVIFVFHCGNRWPSLGISIKWKVWLDQEYYKMRNTRGMTLTPQSEGNGRFRFSHLTFTLEVKFINWIQGVFLNLFSLSCFFYFPMSKSSWICVIYRSLPS